MSALRDPKREKFAQALYANLAAGMKHGAAADLTAEVAGYVGSSRAENARKRAQRADVKRRLAELAVPAAARAQEQIEATVDWAVNRLYAIASLDLGKEAIKTPDQIRAIELLAKIKGWMAPEKADVTVRDANRMTDDELARIATGSSEGAAAPPGQSVGKLTE